MLRDIKMLISSTHYVGLFCHHVIAVAEHLRLDEFPRRYILKRYTKNAVTDPDYNRRDHRAKGSDGTSLAYRRTLLYNEAMRTVNRGCSSDQMFDAAMQALREVNSRMDVAETETTSSDKHSPDGEQSMERDGSNQVHETENADLRADIRPPPVARTKGSKTTDKHRKDCAPAPARKRPEPELDEHGKPKGQRLCSNCNTISGHNARTCKKRQLEKQLTDAHKRIYGETGYSEKVKKSIKKVIAKQYDDEETDEEDILNSDEEEDYEDESDKDESDEDVDGAELEENEEISQQADGEKNSDGGGHSTDSDDPGGAEAATKKGTEIIQDGQRTCSLCNLKTKHNARTCPNKEEILRQRLAAAQQQGTGKKMMPKGKRVCSECNTISGHNARTCKRLQLEEQLRQEKLKLQESKQDKPPPPRRSNRNRG